MGSEKRLGQSESRRRPGAGNAAYKELADSIPDVFFSLDHDLRYTCWNRASERLTGIPASAAIGKKIEELFPDSPERRAILRLCGEVLEKQAPKILVTSRALGGQKGVYDISAYPSSTGLSVFVRDVTERRRNEMALRRSEARHRALFHDTLVAMCVTHHGRIVNVNDAWLDLHGYSDGDEVIGRDIIELVVDEDKEMLITRRGKTFDDGKIRTQEIRDRRRDGTAVLVEVQSSTLYEGRDRLVLSVVRDITERKQIERRLRRTTELLESIAQNLPGIVYRLSFGDPPGVQFFNDQLVLITGYTANDLRPGRLCLLEPLIVEEDRGSVLGEIEKAVAAHEPFGVEYRIRRKDGAIRYVTGRGSPIYDAAGRPVAIDGLLFDSTERRLLQDAAREHQERMAQASRMIALGTLVSGVAHEINNPNNFITLNLPLLRRFNEALQPIIDDYYREQGDFPVSGLMYSEVRESIPKLLAGIEEGARRIRSIVKDLRDFARPGSPAHDQPVDMSAVVRSAVNLLWNSIQKSTTHFVEQHDERLPKVMGNAQRLEQVIINLLQNACEALTSREQRVTIRTASDRQSRAVMVEVRDEGAGMGAEDIERLGRPFFTTKRDRGGMGLGVSISNKIMKEHNGELRYSSEPGRGTTATLILAALPEAALNDRQP